MHLRETVPKYSTHCLEKNGKKANLQDFLGLSSHLSVLTFGEAGKDCVLSTKRALSMDLKTNDTKSTLVLDEYCQLVKDYEPTFFVTPSESCLREFGNNRRERAVKQSRDILISFDSAELPENSYMLGSITVEQKYA
jgi:hypothetical protein